MPIKRPGLFSCNRYIISCLYNALYGDITEGNYKIYQEILTQSTLSPRSQVFDFGNHNQGSVRLDQE